MNPSPKIPRPKHARRALVLALTAVLAVAWAADPQGPPTSGPLTYDEALRLADDAPTVRLAERALELARRQLAVTAAPVRGELTAGTQWTWGERDLGAGGTQDLDDVDFDPIALSLSFPAVGIGPNADAIARARADVARAETDLAAARRAARLDATSGFQRVLRAQGALALATDDLALARLEREAVRLRQEAGAASEPEADRAQLAEERAANVVAAAGAEVEAARRALETALGAPVGAPEGPLPEPATLAADATVAWQDRPDVLSATLQVAETDRTASATLRDNLPSASLRVGAAFDENDRSVQFGAAIDTRSFQPSLEIAYDPDSGPPGVPSGATSQTFGVAVAVRIPLDPTVGQALAAARIGRERARAQLDLTLARAELDVEGQRQALTNALADVDLAVATAALARAEADLADLRFASGSLSELDLRRAVLDANRAELDAERTRDAARLAALRLLDALAADAAPQE